MPPPFSVFGCGGAGPAVLGTLCATGARACGGKRHQVEGKSIKRSRRCVYPINLGPFSLHLLDTAVSRGSHNRERDTCPLCSSAALCSSSCLAACLHSQGKGHSGKMESQNSFHLLKKQGKDFLSFQDQKFVWSWASVMHCKEFL